MSELVPQFEKQTGHKVLAEFAVIAVIKRRIEAGEAFRRGHSRTRAMPAFKARGLERD